MKEEDTSRRMNIFSPTVLFNNSGELMYCGNKLCLVLKDGEWKIHSEFLELNKQKVMVQMSNGIYAFGGKKRGFFDSFETTSEFLPNKSHHWQRGPYIPYNEDASALAISTNEFILIGGKGMNAGKTILKFNILTNAWTVVGNLKGPRSECKVAIFNQKVIICNGFDGNKILKSTEILPFKVLESPSGESEIEFLPIRQAGDTKFARHSGGLGVVQIGDSEKLIRFGNGVPTQEWNDDTETWHISTKIKSYSMSDTAFISKGTHIGF